MQVLKELSYNPNLSLALGYFDGVHLAHRSVIMSAVDYAKKNGTKSAVITFDNHPCCYIWGVCPKYILTRKMREEKIKALGVDYIYELDFESISNLTAEEYLKNILIKYFKPFSISVGWNHHFGCKKSGNAEFLRVKARDFGYDFFELPPQKFDNDLISSTLIRNLLTEGDIAKANKLLGYDFTIYGKVVQGNQVGRTIGFKTANLNYPTELITLPFGVYETETLYNGRSYKSISNFGVRPTLGGTTAVLEVHLLDFDKNIYGENLSVKFKRMIRPEQKFSDVNELKSQIEKDISIIKSY